MHDADLSILRHFAGIRDVTVELLRKAPDDLLLRPNEGDWTPAHAFMHIAGGQCGWLCGLGEGGKGVDERTPPDKAGIEAVLLDARRRMLDFFSSSEVDRMAPGCWQEHVGRDVVLYLTSHEVHHRGRIVAALRDWGLTDTPFEPRNPFPEPDPLGAGPQGAEDGATDAADRSILAHCVGIGDVTLALLRATPEDWLARPMPGAQSDWTLRKAFLHVAGGQCGWLKGLGDGKGSLDEDGERDKEGIERALLEARGRMLDFFASARARRMGLPIHDRYAGRDVVLYLTDHEVHHRSRIVAALWQWGLTDTPFEPREQPLKHDPLEGKVT